VCFCYYVSWPRMLAMRGLGQPLVRNITMAVVFGPTLFRSAQGFVLDNADWTHVLPVKKDHPWPPDRFEILNCRRHDQSAAAPSGAWQQANVAQDVEFFLTQATLQTT
jgi:hypothetical protein